MEPSRTTSPTGTIGTTTTTGTAATGTSGPSGAGGRSGVTETASEVAGTAREEAGHLAHEARRQAEHLWHEARSEVRTQADAQTGRAAERLRELGQQIAALAEGRTEEAGALTDYLDQGRERLQSFARRLDEGGTDRIIDDLVQFGRRRPGTFLLAAIGAGFAVGRLARAGVASSGSTSGAVGGQHGAVAGQQGAMAGGSALAATGTAGRQPFADRPPIADDPLWSDDPRAPLPTPRSGTPLTGPDDPGAR